MDSKDKRKVWAGGAIRESMKVSVFGQRRSLKTMGKNRAFDRGFVRTSGQRLSHTFSNVGSLFTV